MIHTGLPTSPRQQLVWAIIIWNPAELSVLTWRRSPCCSWSVSCSWQHSSASFLKLSLELGGDGRAL